MTPARHFLSIGEVLALLLEEFPEITISKIRFLESQGLIEPERTASGYRKFSQAEVDRLKFILREQRENYLPLKVIRTRLDGDTSDEMVREDQDTAPRGLRHIPSGRATSHPAGQHLPSTQAPLPPISQLVVKQDKSRSFNRIEVIQAANISETVLAELEHFGIVRAHRVGATELFDAIDLEILLIAAKFIELGIDARHLKAWRVAADQEVALFESRVVPLMRQHNPDARKVALEMFKELVDHGAKLRSAFIAAQERDHLQ